MGKRDTANAAARADAATAADAQEVEVSGVAEQAADEPAATCGAHEECGCRHKHTPRSREFQADLQKRLNRAIGQLNGVKGMIDDNRYCGDVLVQLAAAESAIRSVSLMMLQDHMETCMVEQVRSGNDEIVDEVVGLVKRFAR